VRTPDTARSLLEQYVADRPDHPLYRHFHAYEGNRSLLPAAVRDVKTRRIGLAAPRPEPGHFARAFGVADLATLGRADFSPGCLPISNISLTRWGVAFHEALLAAGEPRLAGQLLRRAQRALRTRGAPERIVAAFEGRCKARAAILADRDSPPRPARRGRRRDRGSHT
jgi:hypothetical protein